MAFWGIQVKPGAPYTHSSKNGTGRLRISQATLGIGTPTLRSSVQCNVGDKHPVLLCALLPNKTESLQLDLEFDEAEDVTFSVLGPRSVYLSGYYVGRNRHTNLQDESESFGEDIANSDTHESNRCSDEDEYEDSFINDDEPEPLSPSPVSSIKDDDDEDDLPKKKRVANGGFKRLKKRYQSIESDDEMSMKENDEEDDVPISSVCKKNKSRASAKKTNKETSAEVDKKKKNGDDKFKSEAVIPPVLDLKNKACKVDEKTQRKEEQPDKTVPSSVEIVRESKSKSKKKKRDLSKEETPTGKLADKDDQIPSDTGVDRSLEVLDSVEVVPEKNLKPKKKRKGRDDVIADATDNTLLAGNKQENDQQAIDKSSCIDSNQLANGNGSEEKKIKKKRRKTTKTQEVEENIKKDDEKEIKRESCNKRTLSNGLVIEDLVTGGNSKRKVATAGKKVKVQYVVKLKENGQVIDSTGKSPHKFRLGDKEVIEGLNIGLDGMRVGDKRQLTIPPSMSLGYKGTGENVPPNSWLVFDVEMTSIH
ncbi:peptidyl-prolyl cis-trans isomerase FKBP43-like [Rutidosis leptorrhynchoides]|uniref:peptidyl-prolyl cis-trans isomerase FKBP43-like n=1 Tax=Rutidosis leptorrhynchoides TaxID=125765 RepID=UPI003A98ED97